MDKRPPLTDGSLDEEANAFQRLRPRLFGIAHRILGSVSEAEDVVQDVWPRWQDTDRSEGLNPGAFLAKITTRRAINMAQSARVRREAYIGPWLPEPVDTSVDPQVGAERGEALERPATASWPRSWSRFITCHPIRPVPPMTTIFIAVSLSSSGFPSGQDSDGIRDTGRTPISTKGRSKVKTWC